MKIRDICDSFFAWVIFLILLVMFVMIIFSIGNDREELPTVDGYTVESIDGYTYYSRVHRLTPTPETIKRCMKEALNERGVDND